jgi:hypothetical protein
MKITKVSYGKTINIGNYQSIRVEFTGDTEDEHWAEALETLKEIVRLAEVDILKENKK